MFKKKTITHPRCLEFKQFDQELKIKKLSKFLPLFEKVSQDQVCRSDDEIELEMCEPKVQFRAISSYILSILSTSSDQGVSFLDQSFHEIFNLEKQKNKYKDQTQLLNGKNMRLEKNRLYKIHDTYENMQLRRQQLIDSKKLGIELDEPFLSINERGFNLEYEKTNIGSLNHLKNYRKDEIDKKRSRFVLLDHFGVFTKMFDSPNDVKCIGHKKGMHCVGNLGGIKISITKTYIDYAFSNKKYPGLMKKMHHLIMGRNHKGFIEQQDVEEFEQIYNTMLSVKENPHSKTLRDCYNMVDVNNLAYYSTLFPFVYHISVGFDVSSKDMALPYVVVVKKHQTCGFLDLFDNDVGLSKNYLQFHDGLSQSSMIDHYQPPQPSKSKKYSKPVQYTHTDQNAPAPMLDINGDVLEPLDNEVTFNGRQYKYMNQNRLILEKLNVLESLFGQLIFGLYFSQKYMGFVHNGLTLENICMRKIKNKKLKTLRFKTGFNDPMYEVSTHGYIFSIKNFEKSILRDYDDQKNDFQLDYFDISTLIRDFIMRDEHLFSIYFDLAKRTNDKNFANMIFKHNAIKIIVLVSMCLDNKDCLSMYPSDHSGNYSNLKTLSDQYPKYYDMPNYVWNEQRRYLDDEFPLNKKIQFARKSREYKSESYHYMQKFFKVFESNISEKEYVKKGKKFLSF